MFDFYFMIFNKKRVLFFEKNNRQVKSMASQYHEAKRERDSYLARAASYSTEGRYNEALSAIRKASGVLRNHNIKSSSDLYQAVYNAEQGAYKSLFLQNLEESKIALIDENLREAKIRVDSAVEYWSRIRQNDELRSIKGVTKLQAGRQYIEQVRDWLESPEGFKSIESIINEHNSALMVPDSSRQ